jgi:hypothetical protein
MHMKTKIFTVAALGIVMALSHLAYAAPAASPPGPTDAHGNRVAPGSNNYGKVVYGPNKQYPQSSGYQNHSNGTNVAPGTPGAPGDPAAYPGTPGNLGPVNY